MRGGGGHVEPCDVKSALANITAKKHIIMLDTDLEKLQKIKFLFCGPATKAPPPLELLVTFFWEIFFFLELQK